MQGCFSVVLLHGYICFCLLGLIYLVSSSFAGKQPGPEVIRLCSCSTPLSMKFFLLIDVKMPTVVAILTFMSGKNNTLGLSEPHRAEFLDIFYTFEHLKFHAQLS